MFLAYFPKLHTVSAVVHQVLIFNQISSPGEVGLKAKSEKWEVCSLMESCQGFCIYGRHLKYWAGSGDEAKLKFKLDLVFHMQTSDNSYFRLDLIDGRTEDLGTSFFN